MNLVLAASTVLNALRSWALGAWLVLGGAVGNSYAFEAADLLTKLPARIAQARGSDLVTGVINGQRYVALHFNPEDAAQERFPRVLLIARSTGTGYAYVAHLRLEALDDVEASFNRDSIYLRQITAHHGVYSSRYQFRLRQGRFQLVGVEKQSNTLGAPDGRPSVALWESSSANLLTRTVVYRAQIYEPADDAAHKEALRRFDAGLPPVQGKVRRMSLPAAAVLDWDLSSFDIYEFRASFLCHYFDYRLVFHDHCGTGQKK